MPATSMIDKDGAAVSGLSGYFRRMGRIGFLTQCWLAIVPIAIGFVAFLVSDNVLAPGARFSVVGLLAFASLLILFFTTFWFWRYARISQTLGDYSGKDLTRMVWIGLYASSAGILLSIIVALAEVAYLLFRFLEAPQGGVPVLQTSVDEASWVSAIDLLSLLALILTISAEIVALVLGLLILNRILLATSGKPA